MQKLAGVVVLGFSEKALRTCDLKQIGNRRGVHAACHLLVVQFKLLLKRQLVALAHSWNDCFFVMLALVHVL